MQLLSPSVQLSILLFCLQFLATSCVWENALLLDYDSATFYVSYTGTTAPSSTGVLVAKTGIANLQFTITTSESADGFFACFAQHKVCEVVVSALLSEANVAYRTGDVTVTFQQTTSTAAASADYVGRNIIWPSSVSSSTSLSGFSSLAQTFGGFDQSQFGYPYVPTSVTAYLSGSDLVGLTLTLTDFGTQTSVQSLGDTSGTPENAQVFSGSVTAVYLYSSSGLGAVCGIKFTHGGADIAYGCETSEQEFPIQNNYAFVGFSALQTVNGAGDFVLYPLQYHLLHPRVVSWSATDSSVSFEFNVFWPTSEVTASYDARSSRNPADNSLAYVPYSNTITLTVPSTDISNFPFQSTGVVDTGLAPCSPVKLTLQSVSTLDRTFGTQQYFVWTYGYRVVNESTVQIADSVSSSAFYSSKPTYYSQIVESAQCDELFPSSVAMSGSELLINGIFLGNDQSFTGTPVDLSSKLINTVYVYYNSGTDTLIGIVFAWNDYNYTTLGSAVASDVQVLDFSSDTGQQRFLWYIDVIYSASKTQQLTFYWARAREPVMVVIEQVADGTGYHSNYFQRDIDASMVDVIWYNPAAYSSVVLSLDGYFFGNADSYSTEFATQQTRAQDGSAFLNHLVAGTTYSYEIGGTFLFSPANGEPLSAVSSLTSSTADFTTASGVQILCSNSGLMQMQVNFEALPEVKIRLQSGGTNAQVDMGDAANLVGRVTSAQNAQSLWLQEAHFQYVDSPVNPDFSGYPVKVISYWSSSDTCIRGLALVYMDRNGNELNYWIAGSGTGFIASDAQGIQDWSGFQELQGLPTAVYYQAASNCLRGIEFRNSSGSAISGCLGPAGDGQCSTLAFSQPSAQSGSPDYYLFSLTAGSDNSGDFIYNLSSSYASIDMPVLLARDRVCELGSYFDPHFIRDSFYDLQYNLANDPSVCGTKQELLDQSPVSSVTFDGTNAIYQQKITRERDDPSAKVVTSASGVSITRFNDWSVPSYCFYDAEGEQTGQAKTIQEAGLTAAGVNEFPFSMDIYQDETYSSAYSTSTPTLILGEPVYVMVTADMSVTTFEVVATDCWATPTDNPDDPQLYFIQSSTCASDTTFVRDTVSSPLSDAFHFDAFAWFQNEAVSAAPIYLHCDVRACPTGNSFCQITDPASCPGGKRRRRAVPADDETPPKGSKRYTVHRSDPIFVLKPKRVEALFVDRSSGIVQKLPSGNEDSNSHPHTSFAMLFLFFTFTLTFCMAAKLFRVKRTSGICLRSMLYHVVARHRSPYDNHRVH